MRAYRATEQGKAATRNAEANRKNKDERKAIGNVLRAEYMKTPRGREVAKKALANYRQKHKVKLRQKEKDRWNSQPITRVRANLRRRIRYLLNEKGFERSASVSTLTGCSQIELKAHLERQFAPGMTWDNYGDWHIDHIIPLASAKNIEGIYALCHFTNLQPLWGIDNQRKQDKIFPSVELGNSAVVHPANNLK
jgi:hypothetical protein